MLIYNHLSKINLVLILFFRGYRIVFNIKVFLRIQYATFCSICRIFHNYRNKLKKNSVHRSNLIIMITSKENHFMRFSWSDYLTSIKCRMTLKILKESFGMFEVLKCLFTNLSYINVIQIFCIFRNNHYKFLSYYISRSWILYYMCSPQIMGQNSKLSAQCSYILSCFEFCFQINCSLW